MNEEEIGGQNEVQMHLLFITLNFHYNLIVC